MSSFKVPFVIITFLLGNLPGALAPEPGVGGLSTMQVGDTCWEDNKNWVLDTDGHCCCHRPSAARKNEGVVMKGLKTNEVGFDGKAACDRTDARTRSRARRQARNQGPQTGDTCDKRKEIEMWCSDKTCITRIALHNPQVNPNHPVATDFMNGCSREPDCVRHPRDCCKEVKVDALEKAWTNGAYDDLRSCAEKLGRCNEEEGKEKRDMLCSCKASCVKDNTCCADDQDTKIDESYAKQCSKWKEAFAQVDSDKDDFISLEELKHVMTKKDERKKSNCVGTCCRDLSGLGVAQEVIRLAKMFREDAAKAKLGACTPETQLSVDQCCFEGKRYYGPQTKKRGNPNSPPPSRACDQKATAFLKTATTRPMPVSRKTKKEQKENEINQIEMEALCDLGIAAKAVRDKYKWKKDDLDLLWAVCQTLKPDKPQKEKTWCENQQKVPDCVKKRFNFKGAAGICYSPKTGKVSRVQISSQAKKRGVQPGWSLRCLEEEPFDELNWKTKRLTGKPYVVVFYQDQAHENKNDPDEVPQTPQNQRRLAMYADHLEHGVYQLGKWKFHIEGDERWRGSKSRVHVTQETEFGDETLRTGPTMLSRQEDDSFSASFDQDDDLKFGRLSLTLPGTWQERNNVSYICAGPCFHVAVWDRDRKKKLASGWTTSYSLPARRLATFADPEWDEICDDQVYTKLTQNAEQFREELKVADPSGMKVGMTIVIRDEKNQEKKEIKEISGSTIYLKYGLSIAFLKNALVNAGPRVDDEALKLHSMDILKLAKKERGISTNKASEALCFDYVNAEGQVNQVGELEEKFFSEAEACEACWLDSACGGYFQGAIESIESTSTPTGGTTGGTTGATTGGTTGGTRAFSTGTGSVPSTARQGEKAQWGIFHTYGPNHFEVGDSFRSFQDPNKYMKLKVVKTKKAVLACNPGKTVVPSKSGEHDEECWLGKWVVSDGACSAKCKNIGPGFTCSEHMTKRLTSALRMRKAVQRIGHTCKSTSQHDSPVPSLSSDGTKCFFSSPNSASRTNVCEMHPKDLQLCFCKDEDEDMDPEAFDPHKEKLFADRLRYLENIKTAKKPIYGKFDKWQNKAKCNLPEAEGFEAHLDELKQYGCQPKAIETIMKHYSLLKQGNKIQKDKESEEPCRKPECNEGYAQFAEKMYKEGLFKGADALWSGGDSLSEYAYVHGHTPLEWTLLGACINHNKWFEYDGGPEPPSEGWQTCAENFWNSVSAHFTASMTGDIFIYMTTCQYSKVIFKQEVLHVGPHLKESMKRPKGPKSISIHQVGMKVIKQEGGSYSPFYDGLEFSVAKPGLTHRTCRTEDPALIHLTWAAYRLQECMSQGINQLNLADGKCSGTPPDYYVEPPPLKKRCKDFYECPYLPDPASGSCVIRQQRENPPTPWQLGRRLSTWADRFREYNGKRPNPNAWKDGKKVPGEPDFLDAKSMYPSVEECREHVEHLKQAPRYTYSHETVTNGIATCPGNKRRIESEEECFAASTFFGQASGGPGFTFQPTEATNEPHCFVAQGNMKASWRDSKGLTYFDDDRAMVICKEVLTDHDFSGDDFSGVWKSNWLNRDSYIYITRDGEYYLIDDRLHTAGGTIQRVRISEFPSKFGPYTGQYSDGTIKWSTGSTWTKVNHCSDTENFVDEKNFDCASWTPKWDVRAAYRAADCDKAVAQFEYTQAGQDALLRNCPVSCRRCGAHN